MDFGKALEVLPGTVVHRIGGAEMSSLRPTPTERALSPCGISVLLGGSPQEAAKAMRAAFPASRKWKSLSKTVATASAESIRRAGFDVIPDKTERFANHGRLIHPDGASGFSDEHLSKLALVFQITTGC